MKNILEMKGIVKEFPGVRAVDNVTLTLREGEIHAILGHNGAGKSTFVKVLSGACKKDKGEIIINGDQVDFKNPREAINAGIHMVYQEMDLIPYLSGAENIFLGQKRFHNKLGLIDYEERLKAAQNLANTFDANIDLSKPVGKLNISKQQIVSITKAISSETKIIIFDEPTSSLNDIETNKLFDVMRLLTKEKVSIVLITHRLSDVFSISDRITIMRNGKLVVTKNIEDISREEIIHYMTDEKHEPKRKRRLNNGINDHEIILDCKDISDGSTFKNISFQLRKGEVLGLTGLIGCGDLEVARTIYGASRCTEGEVKLNGSLIKPGNVKDAIDKGLAFVSDDRKRDGLNLVESVKNNISITILEYLNKFGFINRRREQSRVETIVEKLKIRLSSINQITQTLSGGNQQKVVLSKWLLRNADVLILCEPTRGIDVSTKAEIHNMIREFASEGMGVLVVSSEIDEILQTCDRVLVLYEGKIFGEEKYKDFDRKRILSWMYGVK